MLRILLGFLPFIVTSAFTTDDGEADAETDDAPADDGGDSEDEDRIKAQVQRRLNSILGAEKKKIRAQLADEIRKELQEEAARQQKEQAEEFKPLYEEATQELEKAKSEKAEVEAEWRAKLVRSEIKVAAATAAFIDPDVAHKLIEFDAIEFDDAGDPTNITALIDELAKERPYLVQTDTEKRRAVESVGKANAGKTSVADIRNKYLAQAGVKSD